VESRDLGVAICGGVRLTALAMRLKGGDAGVLSEITLAARGAGEPLTWGFNVEMKDDLPVCVTTGEPACDPDQLAGLFAQADFLYQKKRYEAAIECWDRVLSLRPNLPEAYYNRGLAYSLKGDQKAAIADYDRALACTDQDPAIVWLAKGLALGDLGRWEEELRSYASAIDANPRLAEAWLAKGSALGRLGRGEEQLKCYDRALWLSPLDARAWCAKAEALGEMRRWDMELKCYDQAIAVDPHLAEAQYGKGVALLKIGRLAEAARALRRAWELGEPSAKPWLDLLARAG
jgi:tetratricopeptide (TPR) repeat protein